MRHQILMTALLASSVLVATSATSQTNPGLPTQYCTVTNFTSDTGDAAYIRSNSDKHFVITSTDDGFIMDITSYAFRDSSDDMVVEDVTDTHINAIERGQTSNKTVQQFLTIDRAASNGQRTAISTVEVHIASRGPTPTVNQWTLTCEDAD